MGKTLRHTIFMLAVCFALFGVQGSAFAVDCTYCDQEIEEGKNPLKCDNCIKLSQDITKKNDRVWLLTFTRGELGRVQIKDDTGNTEVYWFLPYKLTNKDEVAHKFFIDISARSDLSSKHKHTYHDVWVSDVYEEIRKILGKREGQQLLSQRDLSMPPPGEQNVLPQVSDNRTNDTAVLALPTLQPGESADCVAIFRSFSPRMDKLVISVRGLTNSTLSVDGEDYAAPKDQPNRRVIKEAVLELHYRRPGDEFAHSTDAVVFHKRKWVDIKRTIKSDLKWRPPGEGRR